MTNYRCSYCWPYARSNSKDHRPTEVCLQTIDEIKRQARDRNFNSFQGTKIVGISDLYKTRVKETISSLNSKESIKGYWGKDSLWIEMIKETKPDVVFISTNWDNHAPMAIKSMELGSHAFVEVPMANTIEDLWGIVNVSEKTRKHCMMLENVNYGLSLIHI